MNGNIKIGDLVKLNFSILDIDMFPDETGGIGIVIRKYEDNYGTKRCEVLWLKPYVNIFPEEESWIVKI